jgi:hypothetical protein
MSSVLDYPQVIDSGTLRQKVTAPIYLPIGIEGQADPVGTATVGTLYSIGRPDEADTLFGAASALARLVKQVLNRGAGPVVAVASVKSATLPTLAERQAAWEKFESDEQIRIRLTDSLVQADHVALADSCENADLIYNKQFAVVGMTTGQSKANLIAAATAISSKRAVLIAPGVYDDGGVIRDGAYAASAVAAEIAKNADPSNDLDLWPVPLLSGVEKGADGLPVFRRKVVAGSPVNDYEELLDGGVSPLQPTRLGAGGVTTTHLRTTFTTDTTFDALATRIIVDQIFIDVKEWCYAGNFFRMGNTQPVRDQIQSGVVAILTERAAWIEPVQQPDGTLGYNVAVEPSANMKQVIISYEGIVVRGIQTIAISANLSIPV